MKTLLRAVGYPVLYILVLLSSGLTMVVQAQPLVLAEPQQESVIPKEVSQKIYDSLKQGRPDLHYSNLRLSPLNGIYEIDINGQVAFVSEDGRFLLSGEMYQIQEDGFVNLQEQGRMELRASTLASMSADEMVVYSPEVDTKGFVYIFTDIDCGFCRRLHSQLDDYLNQGIEIRYLAFPRAGVPSSSADKLATVWCADDALDMMDAMKRGISRPIADCGNSPVAAHYQLGQEMGITGTPAIILKSGKMIPGFVSPETLVQEMGI